MFMLRAASYPRQHLSAAVEEVLVPDVNETRAFDHGAAVEGVLVCDVNETRAFDHGAVSKFCV